MQTSTPAILLVWHMADRVYFVGHLLMSYMYFLSIAKEHRWDLGQANSPSWARHENGLEYTRITVTPPRRLVF